MIDVTATSVSAPGTETSLLSGTFFSSQEWAKAWVQAFPERDLTLPVSVTGSGAPRLMHMIQRPLSFGTRSISAGHVDLYSSPGWHGRLELPTVSGILQQLRRRTRSLVWRVRFDHRMLAQHLESLGLLPRRQDTHVLHIHQPYDSLFAGYSTSTRNHVRKASRRGLVIRRARSIEDFSAFQRIYRELAHQKGWQFVYPLELSLELAKLTRVVRFLVAEYEGRVIGGALFLRDGSSAMYLFGAADRAYTALFPASSLIDEGIRWACETGADFFNMGTSGSNTSLAMFKSSFGCSTEEDWIFEWHNPVLRRLGRLKRFARGRTIAVPDTRETKEGSGAADRVRPPTHAMKWSDRASLEELPAVLSAAGSEAENLFMHAATLVGAEAVLKSIRPTDKPLLLDFGCGNGRMIRVLGGKGWNILGSEVSHEMLQAAHKIGMPKSASVVQTDGVTIPLADGSVDIVWVCGVLKYSLFPVGSRCLHGCPSAIVREKVITNETGEPVVPRYKPAYGDIAREMFRVLKPSGRVVQLEMWVNSPPDVFTEAFLDTGFVNEDTRVLRRYSAFLETTVQQLAGGVLHRWIIPAGKTCAYVRRRFDRAERITGHFKDYSFVWSKGPCLGPSKGRPSLITQAERSGSGR